MPTTERWNQEIELTDAFVEGHLLEVRAGVVEALHRVRQVISHREVEVFHRKRRLHHRQVARIVLHLHQSQATT